MSELLCRVLFIDLDDTIWDFRANSVLSLRQVYDEFALKKEIPDYDRFKYYAFRNVILKYLSTDKKKECDELLIRLQENSVSAREYGAIKVNRIAGLFDNLDNISKRIEMLSPDIAFWKIGCTLILSAQPILLFFSCTIFQIFENLKGFKRMSIKIEHCLIVP